MPELEVQLTALASSIDWPQTPPHLWGGAARRATEGPQRRRVPRWALAAAAVVLIVLTLAFTWLGLHTVIYKVQNPPTPTPHSPGQLGSNLDLGTPSISVADAQRQVSWRIVVPGGLGRPDAVYVKLARAGGPSQGEVSLVYAQAPGVNPSRETGVAVLVTEARGSVNQTYFFKILGPDTQLEQVDVHGHPAYWISGHPHDFAFADAGGGFYLEQMRLATNTLVFDDSGTVVRIEGDMTKDQALQIADQI